MKTTSILHYGTLATDTIGGLLFAIGALQHGNDINVFLGLLLALVVIYPELRQPDSHFALAALGVLVMGISHVVIGTTTTLNAWNASWAAAATMGFLILGYAFLDYRYPGDIKRHMIALVVACFIAVGLFVAAVQW